MSVDVTIPGKAYEIAEKSQELGTDLRLKLKMGEKRKKGRGYRVFVSLEEHEVGTLAKFFSEYDVRSLNVIDIQAIKIATTRFCELAGTKPVDRPKSRNSGKGSHMRNRTQDALWEPLSKLIEQRHCRCELRKGMTLDELRALGAGCTDPHDFKYNVLKLPKPKDRNTRILGYDAPGHVCPVLDSYRRALIKLAPKGEDEDGFEI